MYSSTKFSDLAKWTGGRLQESQPDPLVRTLSSDTRSIKPGDIYVALKGENFDGHDFVAEALKRGAAGLILHRSLPTPPDFPSLGPVLWVDETLKAWVKIAAHVRDRFSGPVIAITGSAGKSSTKEMTAKLLGPDTVASPASFNNLLGVSKTLSLVSDSTRYIVLEMGMNASGEIAEMCENFRPVFGLITNIGDAHMGKLGGQEGVYRAKKELFDYLARAGGTAGGIALNVDDPLVLRAWREAGQGSSARTIRFSGNANADADVKILSKGMHPNTGFLSLQLQVKAEKLGLELPLYGMHHASNIAAAIAASLLMGATLERIKERFSSIQAAPHRGQVHQLSQGRIVIDESYNANPTALISSLDSLVHLDSKKHRVLVLGDMLELGEFSRAQHEKIGDWLAQHLKTPFTLIGVGEEMRAVVDSVSSRAPHAKCESYPSVEAATEPVKRQFSPNSVCLVKGSRGVKLDRLVDALCLE